MKVTARLKVMSQIEETSNMGNRSRATKGAFGNPKLTPQQRIEQQMKRLALKRYALLKAQGKLSVNQSNNPTANENNPSDIQSGEAKQV